MANNEDLWGWNFGMALNTCDRETVNNMISELPNEKEALNQVLCMSTAGIWFLRTKDQIELLMETIQNLINRGATAIENAVKDSLTTITCLSSHLCHTIISDGDDTLQDTLAETSEWTKQRLENSRGDPNIEDDLELENELAHHMMYVTLACVDIFEPPQGIDDILQMPSIHQMVGFHEFISLAVNRLSAEEFEMAINKICGPLSIFNDSLNPTFGSAISRTGIPEIIRLLTDLMPDEQGAKTINTWLIEASSAGKTELVDILFQVVDPLFQLDGTAALFFACDRDQLEVAEKLIDHGVTTYGGIPLQSAARKGHLEIVKMLINTGCSEEEIFEALRSAMQNKQHDVVDFIRFYFRSFMQ